MENYYSTRKNQRYNRNNNNKQQQQVKEPEIEDDEVSLMKDMLKEFEGSGCGGKKYGCLSQILYVVLGIAFIPWFGGMTGGLEVFLGSTGGFLIGFIIASYFIGLITEKYAHARSFTKMALVIGIANFALIYIPGLAGLALFLGFQGTSVGIIDLLMMGLIPFIAGDIVKILAAASVSNVFLPKD